MERLFEDRWISFLNENNSKKLEKHPDYNNTEKLEREFFKKGDQQAPWNPEKFYIGENPLGRVGDFDIQFVLGTRLRDLVSPNWVDGGNAARYVYIPKTDIWIENITKLDDLPCYIVHEIVEFHFMTVKGLSYSDAHEKHANKYEVMLRNTRDKWRNRNALEVSREFLRKNVPEALKIYV